MLETFLKEFGPYWHDSVPERAFAYFFSVMWKRWFSWVFTYRFHGDNAIWLVHYPIQHASSMTQRQSNSNMFVLFLYQTQYYFNLRLVTTSTAAPLMWMSVRIPPELIRLRIRTEMHLYVLPVKMKYNNTILWFVSADYLILSKLLRMARVSYITHHWSWARLLLCWGIVTPEDIIFVNLKCSFGKILLFWSKPI